METKKVLEHITSTLDFKKATDILVIDMAEKSSFADYFILASGANERQIDGLTFAMEEVMMEEGIEPKNIEGKPSSGWILMDYGDIIINVLTEEMRAKYSIEKVWEDCTFLRDFPRLEEDVPFSKED